MRRSLRWLAIAVAAAVAGSVLSVSSGVVAPREAAASHVRAAQLTWERVDADTASFHVTFSSRASYLGWGDLGVGGRFILDGDLDFGDGTFATPELTIVLLDPTNDYLVAEGTITKDYAGPGPFTASLASCCRLEIDSGHMNNGGFSPSWRVQTTVDLTTARSPRSTISPIVDCPINDECSFTVGAIAPPGTSLRYRFASGDEAGDGGDGLPFTQPPGATLDAQTGRYTWNTTGAELHPSAPSTFYSTQVVVEAVNGSGSVVGSSAVDFFIRLGSGSANEQPHFHDPTPEDGTTIDAFVGVPVTFQVQAEDHDAGDTVTPGILGLPAGATFDVTPGNPAFATFSWTPTTTGTSLLILTAQDQNGLGAVARSISIDVTDDVPGSPLVIALGPATSTGDTGTDHTVTATVTRDGTPQAGLTVGFWLIAGPNVGTGGPATTNAAGQATFTYQSTTAGTDTLLATVDDAGTVRTSNSVTRTWNEAPGSPIVIALGPATSTGDTGTDHTVTATVTRAGAPQAGLLVGFWLMSGPNVGTGGPGTTNAAGQATFTYQSTTAGTDSLLATVFDGDVLRASNSVTRTWNEPPPPLGTLEVGSASEPDVVTAGAALLRTITVTNTGGSAVAGVTVTFAVPAGGTLVFTDPSQGSCGPLTGGTVTCLVGTLGGGTSATVRIAIGVPGSLPAGSTFSVPATVTADGEPPVTSEELPTPVEPPVPGEAHGFVPPGGTLRTGTVATPEDNTIASFSLPNTGPGAVISITSEPCAPGVCFGKTMTFTPFEGYDDPRNPAVFSITWDRTVRGTGLFSQAYVLKENETEFRRVPPCRRPPARQQQWQWDWRNLHWFWTWGWFNQQQPTYWDWLLGGRTGYASPSPCVDLKTFVAGGDLRFDTLFLSGDPSMRRR